MIFYIEPHKNFYTSGDLLKASMERMSFSFSFIWLSRSEFALLDNIMIALVHLSFRSRLPQTLRGYRPLADGGGSTSLTMVPPRVASLLAPPYPAASAMATHSNEDVLFAASEAAQGTALSDSDGGFSLRF